MSQEPNPTRASQNKVVKVLHRCWRYDVTTSAGRRLQSFKIISVAMVSMFGLLFFVAEDVYNANEIIKRANSLNENLQSSLQVAYLIHRLQIERGLTVMCMGATDEAAKKNVFMNLIDAREKTDEALRRTKWPFDENVEAEFLRRDDTFQNHLTRHR